MQKTSHFRDLAYSKLHSALSSLQGVFLPKQLLSKLTIIIARHLFAKAATTEAHYRHCEASFRRSNLNAIAEYHNIDCFADKAGSQ